MANQIEVAVGIEDEHGVVLEDGVRWGGEALDVQEGEANAVVADFGHGGGGSPRQRRSKR